MVVTPTSSETFRHFGTKFLELGHPSKRSANYRRNQQAMIDQLCEFRRNGARLGDRPIDTINESAFEAFIDINVGWTEQPVLATTTYSAFARCRHGASRQGLWIARGFVRPWRSARMPIRTCDESLPPGTAGDSAQAKGSDSSSPRLLTYND